MKKLIVFASTILLIFTACSPTSSDLPSEEVDTSNYSVNTEYLDEIALALENTYVNYESLELSIFMKENESRKVAMPSQTTLYPFHYLISKEPYMGLYTILRDDNSISFQDIYIKEQNIEGSIRLNGEHGLTGEPLYTPDEGSYSMFNTDMMGEFDNGFMWYTEFRNLQNIVSNTDFVVNTVKDGDVYTIVASDEYFVWNKDAQLSAARADFEKDGEETSVIYEGAKKFLDSQEGNLKTYTITIKDGIITQIIADEYFLSTRQPYTYEYTSTKHHTYSLYIIDILRLNDNEAIQNEIQEVYDNALKN